MLRFLLTGGFSSIFVAWLLVVLLRLPLLLTGIPLTQPELNWMLVGERLHNGFMIYTQTWDSLSPLTSGVYALIDVAAGRSHTTYLVLSLVLVLFQSVYFSYTLQRHGLYNERTHFPAILYGICATLFFDFYTASPVLLGLTFLVVGLNSLFTQLDKDNKDDEAFGIGFYLGMATLFYMPFCWFLVYVFVVFMLLSAIRLRKFLLLFFGFTLPLIVVVLYFYMINGYEALYYNWISVFWERFITYYADWQTFILVASPLALLLLVATGQLIGGSTRFINYQIRCQQAMFLLLITSVFTLFFADAFTPYIFLVFVPGVAYFGTHYFLLIRRKWIGDLVFFLFLGGVFFNNWGRFYLPMSEEIWHDTSLVVTPKATTSEPSRRLLIIGQALDEYQHNVPATPYLNWRLARRHFENLDSYNTIIELYDNFSQDPPEMIIDKKNVVPTLFKRLPALASQYEKGNSPNTYVHKKK